MASMTYALSAVLVALLPLASAVPAPNAVAEAHPLITEAATLVDRTPTPVRRDLSSYLGGIFSSLGSDIPSYVASGVPNFFQNFPSGSAVASSLGLSDDDLAALPTSVLNLP